MPSVLETLFRRSLLLGYLVAVGGTIVASAASPLSGYLTGVYAPAIMFVPVIVAAAALGGIGPGLLATGLAGVASLLLLFDPIGFAVDNPKDYVRLVLLLGTGVVVSVVLELAVRQRRRIDEERERLGVTLASIGDGVIRTDVAGRVEGLNGVAADLVGWSESEALGRPLEEVFRVVREGDRAPIENFAKQALKERRVLGNAILLAKDGRELPIEESASPIRDGAGNVLGAVLVFRDVTRERRAAQALRAIEARRSAMLDSALDGIVAIDADGSIIDFNPAAERIFGYSRREALGQEMTGLIVAPAMRDAHRRGLARYLETGESKALNQRLELLAVRKDGTEFPMEVSIAAATVDGETLFVGYLRDISHRKRIERERTFFVDLAAQTQPLEDPAELTQTVARLLAEHLDVDRCAYAEVENEEIFVVTGDYTRGVPSIVGRWPAEEFGAEFVRSMLADEPFVAEDSEDDPRIGPQDVPAYRATNIRGVICVPLRKRGTFIAAMAVHTKEPRRWTGEEVAFVRNVVNRCWEALERSRTVRRLRESEERYRSLVTATSAIVWDMPASGEFETPQPSWAAFTGQSLQEYRGWGWIDAVHPDYRQETATAWNRALSSATPYAVEHRLRRADGEWRDMNVRAVPILDDRGAVREWIGVHYDVTERKRAEEALRESEERYRTLFETMDEGFCVVEMIFDDDRRPVDYRFVETNPAFEKHTGLAAATGRTAREMLPDLEERWFEVYGEVALTGRAVRFVEGAEPMQGRVFDVNAFRLGGEGSRRVAILFNDVTERIRSERERKEHEERFRLLVEQVEDFAIFMTDVEGRPTTWNEGVYRVLGFEEEDFVGREVSPIIFVPEDVADGVPQRELDEAARTGKADNDRWMRRKDGTRFYALGVTSGLRDERGELLGFMKVMRDQTDRKRMEDELRRVAEELSETDRRKDEFLATLAHELRNPLAPIRTGLELLKLSGDDPQETAEVRDMMERQAQQMMRLIDDLLEVARITQGKLELRTCPVSLADAVRSAVDAARPLVDEAGHELIVTLPPEPIRVEADPHRLQQVFANLINNAAKYTPEGGRIEVSAAREEGGVAVRVRDDGVGIPPEMRERIFEMFAQIERSMERAYSGLGIGLTLVKRLVEMHGGRVEVNSEGAGRGSEFVVHLPTRLPDAALEEDSPGPAEPPAGGLKALVVDDNRPAADTLAKVIRILGNEVRTAYDGREAIDVAEEFRPDVIFMDLGMPRMNGYEATREIRRRDWGGGMVIVALTGWGQDEDRRRTQEAGFDRHLVKPVEPSTLQKVFAETKSGVRE